MPAGDFLGPARNGRSPGEESRTDGIAAQAFEASAGHWLRSNQSEARGSHALKPQCQENEGLQRVAVQGRQRKER
jgi:hypothetical protein